MTLAGPCGVRQVCQYLELTGLDQFVASSHSAQHNVSIQLEQAAAAFAQQEQVRLAETMEPRQITVCQDETFHPEICLVAIEPVSNFILLEAYSESRTAQEWTDAMQAAVQGLPVDIIQSVSDEGAGILCLRPEVEQAVLEKLIPAAYIKLAAKKARCAEDRARLDRKAEELLAPLLAPDGLLTSLDPAERGPIERVVDECAGLFQRSSSCVEGRNGQLSLRHHGFHRLSIGKLTALTAVHNFWLKRKDGTTAAERFFRAKPRDMFEYLLSRVDLPGWPAQKKAMT